MSAIRTVKQIAASALAVTRERRRGDLPSPRWSWAFHVGVRYLRDGFLHLDSLPVAEHRAEMEKMNLADPALRKVEIDPATIAGRPAERTRPKGRAPTRSVLYLHGGSYHYGSPRTHRPLIARLAHLADAEVVALDYRMAPEAPFPAGLEDAVAAYQELLGARAPKSVVIAGDSAGGGLTGATLLALRDRGIPLPAGAAMICPWTDLRERGGSMVRNAGIDWLNHRTIDELARSYAGRAALDEPLVSPLHGDLRGLPPVLVQVGSLELLHDQAVAFAEKALAAGVAAELRVWEGMVHDWHFLALLDRQGLAGIEEIAEFVRRVAR